MSQEGQVGTEEPEQLAERARDQRVVAVQAVEAEDHRRIGGEDERGGLGVPGAGAGNLGTPPARCDPGPDATVDRYEAQDVSLTVAPSNPGGLLVLSDQWYPGWTATVDGKPATILRGDVALRAVALSPGAHRIRFRYQPRWPLNGLAVFAFTVAVGAVLALGRRPHYHAVRQS
ncbi:MAG TPA: YfhO family protein [Acidimicrobiia bacterium]|nr:YfhO family protein [Acidimicrobiia bacterium]